MKNKSVGLLTVVLFGLCAVIWIAGCVLDYSRPSGLDGLRVACAITWSAAFVAQLSRYLKARKQEE